jgi:acetoin utilization deacetylase AcuC-like enzyme
MRAAPTSMRAAPDMAGYRTSMAPTIYLSHPSSLDHDTGAHPERAARIVAIERELAARDWLGCERRESPAAGRDLLELVHTPEHVDRIERLCAEGGGPIDLDTVVSERSCVAATHAAGGAVEMVDLLLAGDAGAAFSSHRPPGHHAERARAMGFCLFNNVAIAAAHAIASRRLSRVLVLDWDVHHGNGTDEIFHATDSVLYISIHEAPLYPGTGPASDVGDGPGRGYTINLPVPPGSGDDVYESLVEHVVAPIVGAYEPELVLISAGYDAHAEDPLADCAVSDSGYAAMTASMRRACAQVKAPIGVVLEGGYALDALARSVAATIGVLATDHPSVPAAPDEHPLARAARERLAEFWPQLA